MNEASSNPRLRPALTPHTLRISATTRAVRSALAVSATMLALSAGNPAFASDCNITAPLTVSCNGEFTTPAPDSPLVFATDDLTVILGADYATGVTATGVDGIQMTGTGGSESLLNYADVTAYGGAGANAVDIWAYGDISVVNAGNLVAVGDVDDVTAVTLYSANGSISLDNAGAIQASTDGNNATGVLAYANGYGNIYPNYSDVTVANAGAIGASVDAAFGYVLSRGIVSYGHDVTVANDGSITAESYVEHGNTVSIAVENIAEVFSTLENGADGVISAVATSGEGVYYGADAASFGAFVLGSSAYVHNAGSISAQSTVYGGYALASAWGVETYGNFGFATLVNDGDISASASVESIGASYAFAYGALTKAFYGAYVATTSNIGSISADARVYRGAAIAYGADTYAKYATTYNDAGATISATATVDYSGLASAVGVADVGTYYSHVVNAGTISAYASSHGLADDGRFTYGSAGATGVVEDSRYLGGVVLANYGDILATAIETDSRDFFGGGAGATGVHQYGKYYAGLHNLGDISAFASTDLGIAAAYGVIQQGKYGSLTYLGNEAGANIIAAAYAGSTSDDYAGGRAIANGVRMFGGSSALEYNWGLISAKAVVDPGDRDYLGGPYTAAIALAYGTYLRGVHDAGLYNYGVIQAYAEADFGYANAYGAMVNAGGYATSDNEGTITAIANADHGIAFAVGSYTRAHGIGTYHPGACNYYGPGGYCYGYDLGYTTYEGGDALLDNSGAIHAHGSADGGIAYAYGAVVIGRESVGAYNSGEIIAVADGGYGSVATGLEVVNHADGGDAYVRNDSGGLIAAAAYGPHAYATAVYLVSTGTNTLRNYGEITAAGDGDRVAILSSVYAVADLLNDGVVTGSIQTGNYDDALVNSGTWHAVQQSYLGAGDDSIQNPGLLRMDNASIDLGTYSDAGNSFDNDGTIRVSGAGNYVFMGGAAALLPSANPNAFENDGLIDFRDGAPDDRLTIVGDFAGDGAIAVDVRGLGGIGDLLAIYGDVVDGTANSINVVYDGVPTAPATSIPIVFVSGDSVAANFALGQVSYSQKNFLTLGFSLQADIDGSNATDDVFSLGVGVTGLSDPGTLAAAIAPGAQNLMNSLTGTWRQRMGVIDRADKGGLGLWARVFQSDGSIEPGHVAANFGQGGNFAFDQKNSGSEVGVDFAMSEQFSWGLLVSTAEAKQSLRSPGVGADRIKGDSYGFYGTWISPQGFYLDGSYRRMDFRSELQSIAGAMRADGDAHSLNLEAGYGWKLANGLALEPQVQWTRTEVDNIEALSTAQASFKADGGASSVGRLGLSVRKDFQPTGGGAEWSTYGSVSAVRDFDGRSGYSINQVFSGDIRMEGNSTLVELGVTANIGKLALSAGVNWQDGGALRSFVGGQLNLRYTFGGSSE